ncbi:MULTISPECIES: DUF2470 domain-containing protein [Micromonospora]|uniref:DUF2470 domain-containing protein n=1 Tax=Micromonospora TaxID=1873 RepID=UPI000B81A714|nr:DUF2470 domain-containing protein [Micromonospora yangpuensis]
MRPSPAELVRTLTAGRLPALVHVAHRPGPHHVRHVTDQEGQLLMLVPVVSDLAVALEPATGGDVAVVLDVLDLPPGAGAPSLGRAWVSGRASRLRDDAQRQATLDFADVAPTGDLLDVGTRFRLYRFEVAEARLERAGTVLRVDPGEYAAAEPDPLHPVEAQVLADLADHHGAEVTGYVRRHLGPAAPPGPVRPVRVDRYGLVVTYGRTPQRHQLRLAFPHPVRHPGELARALHPVLCRPRPVHTPD